MASFLIRVCAVPAYCMEYEQQPSFLFAESVGGSLSLPLIDAQLRDRRHEVGRWRSFQWKLCCPFQRTGIRMQQSFRDGSMYIVLMGYSLIVSNQNIILNMMEEGTTKTKGKFAFLGGGDSEYLFSM